MAWTERGITRRIGCSRWGRSHSPAPEGPILAPCLGAVFLQQLLGFRPLHLLVEPLLPKMQLCGGISWATKGEASENQDKHYQTSPSVHAASGDWITDQGWPQLAFTPRGLGSQPPLPSHGQPPTPDSPPICGGLLSHGPVQPQLYRTGSLTTIPSGLHSRNSTRMVSSPGAEGRKWG